MYETFATEDEQFEDPTPCAAGPTAMEIEPEMARRASPVTTKSSSAWDDDRAQVEADNITWPDDPLRLYLNQIGKISLLSHKEEVSLARQVELSRRRFRREMLQVAFVLHSAVRTLERVHDKKLPFDRTIQVSVSDHLEKHQITGRFPHNLKTLEVLKLRNGDDYRAALSRNTTKTQRRTEWTNLIRRRCRATRLVE